jgi:protocatechuate 3,4-dioxygenase beta subunit
MELTSLPGDKLLSSKAKLKIKNAILLQAPSSRSGKRATPAATTTRLTRTRLSLIPIFSTGGKAVTDKDGNYRFRTIVPGAYPADDTWMRPPHIHFKISKLGYMELITQMYFNGNDLLNSRDLILSRLSQEQQKEVIVEFKNRADAPHPVGTFNIKIEKL